MLRLITTALRKPISVLVVILGIVFFSVLAIQKSPIDILPKLGLPTIYVAQTYGGLSPQQMEGFITSYYEYHFLYITGIKYVESKSVQGVALIKLQFHEGTDMANAMAETIAYVNRAKSFMPPGTLPPFVMRYDAGSVPVGQLVFSSESRSLNEIQDLALFKVRPMFSSLYPLLLLWVGISVRSLSKPIPKECGAIISRPKNWSRPLRKATPFLLQETFVWVTWP